jgi:uncharacterized protein YbbK (DUF523 family)
MKLCSACLLGITCRYDGKSKPCLKIQKMAFEEKLVPVCPEQLGGLCTPRDPAEIVNNQVMTVNGFNVTEQFLKGAKMVLEIAKLLNIKEAILKQKSPSCGCNKIYDGTFSNTIKKGYGYTAKLLLDNGIKVLTEEDF